MDLHQRWIPRVALAGQPCTSPPDWPTHAPASWSMLGWPGRWTATQGREAILFLALGLAFALAELARWSVRATGHLPARLGEWLVGIGALIGLVAPPRRLARARTRRLVDVGRPENGRLEGRRRPGVQVRR